MCFAIGSLTRPGRKRSFPELPGPIGNFIYQMVYLAGLPFMEECQTWPAELPALLETISLKMPEIRHQQNLFGHTASFSYRKHTMFRQKVQKFSLPRTAGRVQEPCNRSADALVQCQ